MLHGDLYAHNILWDGVTGMAVLSDFGAASFLPEGGGGRLERLEVRAWGLLLGELLDRCDGAQPSQALRDLQAGCVRPDPAARPTLAAALEALASLA
jgi:serine/threonine protein kinase